MIAQPKIEGKQLECKLIPLMWPLTCIKVTEKIHQHLQI